MRQCSNLLYGIIIILPIIDMATAFTENWPISVGTVIRPLIMISILLYLMMQREKRPFIFLLSYSVIAISFIIQFFTKSPFFFLAEMSFYLKIAYFTTMLWLTTHLITTTKTINKERLLQAANIALIIIGITYWLAFFTNTYTKSYSYIKTGNAGWYFSANELSVIILILFALALIRFTRTLNKSSILGVLLASSIFPMIGTKTALYGGFIVLIPVIFYTLFQKKHPQRFLLLILGAALFIYIPSTSGATNEQMEQPPVEKTEETHTLLSSRDVYLQDTFTAYQAATTSQKLFGLGYGGNYTKEPKTIEMDFFDLFFSLGIIGTAVILLACLILARRLLTWNITFTYLYSIGVLGLAMGISFVAGHVLFAPAVITYVAIFTIWTGGVRDG